MRLLLYFRISADLLKYCVVCTSCGEDRRSDNIRKSKVFSISYKAKIKNYTSLFRLSPPSLPLIHFSYYLSLLRFAV